MGPGFKKTSAEFINECSEICSNEHDCCSFEFSPKNQECLLYSNCKPDNSQFGDYIFCQKSKHFSFKNLPNSNTL